jgi:uncharacterized protein (DUF927 family)
MPMQTTYTPSVSTHLTRAEVADYYRQRVPGLRQTNTSEWRGRCPVHNGDNENFAVQSETGLWHCHSQCERGGDVFQLEGELSGLTDFKEQKRAVYELIGRESPAARAQPKTRKDGKVTAEFVYQTAEGRPYIRVQRKEMEDGSKQYPQCRFTGGRWQSGVKGLERLPYRLPELLAAPADEIAWIPEGEKCVDRLRTLGLIATCNPEGAGKAWYFRGWLEHFKGRAVVILPDNDAPGRKHADEIASILHGVAASVKVLALPRLAERGDDVADWLDCYGGTVEELKRLADEAALVTAAPVVEVEPEARDATASLFTVNRRGIWYGEADPGGETKLVWLADPIQIEADTVGDGGRAWGRLLRWKDQAGNDHRWAMPKRLLASDTAAVRAALVDRGLNVTPSQKLRERLSDYLSRYPASGPRIQCSSRAGWQTGGGYLLPGWCAAPQGKAELIYQSATGETGAHWQTGGTAAEWREKIGSLCVGNSRLVLAASVGFGGPLLELAGADGGGFHAVGPSSVGKTTMLLVGASVCGGGPDGGPGVHSWRTTANGLEALAAAHSDGTLILDELSQCDPAKVAEAAYLLGNGRAKERMTATLAAGPAASWRLLFLSSGELSLSDHAATGGQRARAGAEVRLVNIPADAGRGLGLFEKLHGRVTPAALADELRDAAKRFHGAVFREFVQWLVNHRDEAGPVVAACRAKSKRWVPPGASGEVGRVADRFAVVAAAGELATIAGATGWPKGEALQAAERCFHDWLARRGTVGAADAEEGIRAVRLFLEWHGAARFQPIHPGSELEQSIPNRAGFRRDGEYFFLPEVFKAEVLAGFDPKAVLEALRDRGHLVHEADRLQLKPRILGRTQRVYAIRDSILTGPAEGEAAD